MALGTAQAARNYEPYVVAAIVVFGMALRGIAVVAVPGPLTGDYEFYWKIANHLLNGNGLSLDKGPTAFVSLGYPIFLAGVFKVFGASVLVGTAANVVLGGLTILLVHVTARMMFGSWQVGALAALLAAALPDGCIYAACLAKESLMTTLVVALLAITVAAARHRLDDRWAAVAAGLLVGALMVVGNAGMAMLPGILLPIFYSLRRAQSVRFVVVSLAVAAVVVAPLMWRNHAALGGYVVNTNGGVNLYIGQNPNADAYYQSLADTPLGKDWQQARFATTELDWDRTLKDLAVANMKADPLAVARRAVAKAIAFWLPPPVTAKAGESRLVQAARVVEALVFCVVLGLALLSLARWRANWRELSVVVVMVAGYTAVHMIFYVLLRYRVPMMPVLCLAAGLGLHTLLVWMGRFEVVRAWTGRLGMGPPHALREGP